MLYTTRMVNYLPVRRHYTCLFVLNMTTINDSVCVLLKIVSISMFIEHGEKLKGACINKVKSNNNLTFTLHFIYGVQGGHISYFLAKILIHIYNNHETFYAYFKTHYCTRLHHWISGVYRKYKYDFRGFL